MMFALCYYNMTGEEAYEGDLIQGFSSNWQLTPNLMMELKNNLLCELFFGRYLSSLFLSLPR